jgi:hypothetical protein
MVITYAMGPVALLALRQSVYPKQKRPFHLPFANVLCPLAFYCCNLFSYWTGWDTISKLAIALCIGMGLFLLSMWRGRIAIQVQELRQAMWIFPYLTGLVIISYFGAFGGKNIIPFGWDFVIIGFFSLAILYWAIQSRAEIIDEAIAPYLHPDLSVSH